jgi:hypothetical protein
MASDGRCEVFSTAGAYHGALARYYGALANGKEIEDAAQELLGRGLFYRSALERIADGPVRRRRLLCLKALLRGAQRQYMAAKK